VLRGIQLTNMGGVRGEERANCQKTYKRKKEADDPLVVGETPTLDNVMREE